jgi:hypothetical protein
MPVSGWRYRYRSFRGLQGFSSVPFNFQSTLFCSILSNVHQSWHLRIGMIIFLRVLLVDPFLREMIMAACMMIDRDLARLVSFSPHVNGV